MDGSKRDSLARRSYRKVFRRRRLRALLVSGLAVFVGCCLACAWGVQGFTTTTELTLRTSGAGDWTEYVRKTVQDSLDRAAIESAMVIVGQQVAKTSSALPLLERGRIEEPIRFQVERDAAKSVYRIKLYLIGEGSPQESLLLGYLAANISRQLYRVNVLPDHVGEYDQQARALDQSFDGLASLCDRSCQKIENGLDQLDDDLQDLYEQLTSRDFTMKSMAGVGDTLTELNCLMQQWMELQKESGLESAKQLPGESDLMTDRLANLQSRLQSLAEVCQQTSGRQPFSRVGHTGRRDGQILKSLELMDPGRLNGQLGELRNDLQACIAAQRETVDQLVVFTNRARVIDSLVQQDIQTKSFPVEGVPSPDQLLLFGLVSVLSGLLVGVTYRPELADNGFHSCQHVSDSLGLPVVAEVRSAGAFMSVRPSRP
ncbi:MAG: hypothetical protein VYE64_00850, partial [Planctomycetota bacterium]|nr:hypothetical protein [Planctomycetota bacterium]